MTGSGQRPAFAVIHGFGEGRRISRRFRQALRQHGFQEESSVADADVIIAHSAGCLEVPATANGKTILLFNPSLYPQSKRLMLQAMGHKVWLDFITCLRQRKLIIWGGKSLWNLKYIVTRPGYDRRITQLTLHAGDRLPMLPGNRVVVITSQYDPWAAFISDREVLSHSDYAYITYPGSHDQLWIEPDRFAGVVQSWYESAT